MHYRQILLDQINNVNKQKKSNSKEPIYNILRIDSLEDSPRKSYDERKGLDDLVQRKKEDSEIQLKNKIIEHQEMKKIWKSQEEQEEKRKKERRQAKAIIAQDQLLQASVKKQSNYLINEIEKNHNKLLVEENIKKIDEREIKKAETVFKRIKFVHDDERLKKLVNFYLASKK